MLKPKPEHRAACLHQLAQCINELNGRYIVSWDSGITTDDLALIKKAPLTLLIMILLINVVLQQQPLYSMH